jgi:hypothetical protein
MSLNGLLVVATLLGGVAALWYFWDKISSWWVRFNERRKPGPPDLATQPSHENIERVVRLSDPAADWNHETIDSRSITAYRRDLNLRFEINYSDEGTQYFVEAWANRHPDPRASGYWCDLYYASTLIERFILVAVDGGRAMLPIPRCGSDLAHLDEVTSLEYKIAQIHDTLGTLDQYLRRSGLRVSPNCA